MRCFYCGIDVIDWDTLRTYMLNPQKCPFLKTIDHKIPKRLGGSPDDICNLVIACHRCNVLKGGFSAEDYRQSIMNCLRLIEFKFYGESRNREESLRTMDLFLKRGTTIYDPYSVEYRKNWPIRSGEDWSKAR